MANNNNHNKNLTFQYVFLPADASVPVQVRTGNTSGGLSNDELVQSAKDYFFHQSGGAARAAAFEQATPDERHALAEQFRIQQKKSHNYSQVAELGDTEILSFLQATHGNPSCEIMALTVPTKGNNYQAVSMYVSEHGEVYNDRASDLLKACGHRLPEKEAQKRPGVYGDVFVGRCYDNEGEDEWTRVDFGLEDLSESSDWMAIAKAAGGGGGSGVSNASSLSGTMKQIQMQQQQQQEELGYNWVQTNDEVELKFAVDGNITAKQVSVKFTRSTLKVTVAGETLVEGATGGTVVVDDSTYTFQDDGNGGRELCIVLGKQEEGRTWAVAVKNN